MFLCKDAMKVFTEMKESLHQAVYDSVGKQLVAESKLQQQCLNEKLGEKIHKFTKDLHKTVKEITEEQFESKVRQIVQEEMKKGI